MRKILNWLEDNWSKSTIFLALYISLMLLVFGSHMEFALLLIWLHTPVYLLHQFEEYIYPGGFMPFFNKYLLGSNQPDFPLTKTASLWINLPIIYIGYPLSAILAGSFGLSFGIWVAYFSILNATSHIVLFAVHRYNPGFVVSLVLNVPVGLFTIGYFISNDLISLQAHMIGIGIAIILQGGLMVYGFVFLKPKITHPS